VIEAIQSALPLVDEFVVNVGKSEDKTLQLIQSINSKKIRIVESIWDETMKKNGQVLGAQQDIALSHCTGDWAFLLQGDEVVHEDDIENIGKAMERYLGQPHILGLVFRMVHFKGDYWSVDPWMYRKATRIIRNNGQIHSSPDGCDFRTVDSPRMLKSGSSGEKINARMFHYGWVKHSRVLQEKLEYQKSLYDGDRNAIEKNSAVAARDAQFPKYGILKTYKGSHPKVMTKRIQESWQLCPKRNRWLNWRFYREVFDHGFKG